MAEKYKVRQFDMTEPDCAEELQTWLNNCDESGYYPDRWLGHETVFVVIAVQGENLGEANEKYIQEMIRKEIRGGMMQSVMDAMLRGV